MNICEQLGLDQYEIANNFQHEVDRLNDNQVKLLKLFSDFNTTDSHDYNTKTLLYKWFFDYNMLTIGRNYSSTQDIRYVLCIIDLLERIDYAFQNDRFFFVKLSVDANIGNSNFYFFAHGLNKQDIQNKFLFYYNGFSEFHPEFQVIELDYQKLFDILNKAFNSEYWKDIQISDTYSCKCFDANIAFAELFKE